MIAGLIGMVHLGPLPGSPRAADLEKTITSAVLDATRLDEAGFDALLIENFGDAPFHTDRVPDVTVAAMTRAVTEVAAAVDLPIGVNVLSGTMYTDQGPIVGRAADVARLKASLAPDLRVLADVFVKHATPPPGLTLDRAATDLWERGGADGIVVSGAGTGRPLDRQDLEAVRAVVPEAPLYAGSGVTVDTVAELLEVCVGVIVGTATKAGGVPAAPVDPDAARAIAEAVR